MDPALIKALVDAIASKDPVALEAAATNLLVALAGAEASEPPGADALAEGAAPVPPDPNAPPKPDAAMASALMRLSGCKSEGEAVAYFTRLRGQVDSLDAERSALEMSSRVELVGELVKLGVDTPATAWAALANDAPANAPRVPVKRLLDEPIAELRSRVEALRVGRPAPVAGVVPPSVVANVAAEIAKLSKETLEAIKAKGLTPEQFIEARNRATKRST